jgi:hypothetical protein
MIVAARHQLALVAISNELAQYAKHAVGRQSMLAGKCFADERAVWYALGAGMRRASS